MSYSQPRKQSYFIKQFYGEINFHRDEKGKVDYLDFEMRVPNSAASERFRALKIPSLECGGLAPLYYR